MKQAAISMNTLRFPKFKLNLLCKSFVLMALAVVMSLTSAIAEPGNAAGTSPDLPKELRGSKYVLLEFYADWCGICQEMEPYITTLQTEECAGFHVLKLNIDKPDNKKYADMYGIEGVPTFILFDKKGKSVYRMDQVISPTVLRKKVYAAMGQSATSVKTCK